MSASREPVAAIITGVSGSGKSTVGRWVARELGWEFHDADDHHPESNIRKMSSGRPLNDDDRAPWLDALRALLEERSADGASLVLACSALKRAYRDRLRADGARFVHLHAEPATLACRLRERASHFFDPSLLQSQLDTLEKPGEDEADVIATDLLSLQDVVREVLNTLAPDSAGARTLRYSRGSDTPTDPPADRAP